MAPKFQIKVFQLSRFVKNFTIISVVTLSFLLVFFSKTDYYLISGIKNLSSSVVIPITRFISAPINVFSNFIDEYNQFRSLKFENKILQEEIIRLKNCLSLCNRCELSQQTFDACWAWEGDIKLCAFS